MGLAIGQSNFCNDDEERFEHCLQRNIQALERLLKSPGFGAGKTTLGAELEVYIVDQHGRPLCRNQEIQQSIGDPQLTLELNRYNLEYNLSPVAAQGQAFTAIENEIHQVLATLNQAAAAHQGRIIPIGILPTLTEADFGPSQMTSTPRYHALVARLKQRRKGKFHIDIEGTPPLRMEFDDVTTEGANTSLQIHLRVPPDRFAATYNAVQLATPLVLGLSANSPTFLGHRLWQETRIPLFKQSIDSRSKDGNWLSPARVQYGHGWLREGALELFRETVSLYSPLLPVCSDSDPIEQLEQGQTPELAELRLHQSTVWFWNRAIYDNNGGGHLRIEMRALPAGPTPQDMMANAALLVGLALAIAPATETLLPALPFQYAEYNFYRAAQQGLSAQLIWPDQQHSGVMEKPLTELIAEWLPAAADAIAEMGIEEGEIRRLFAIASARIDTQQNGASWQLAMMDVLARAGATAEEQQQQMVANYLRELDSGRPVAEWSLKL